MKGRRRGCKKRNARELSNRKPQTLGGNNKIQVTQFTFSLCQSYHVKTSKTTVIQKGFKI